MPCCVRCKPCSPRSRSFTARLATSKKSASIGSARRKADADRLVANVQAKLLQKNASSLDVFAAVEAQVVELAPFPVKGSVRRNEEFQAKRPIEPALSARASSDGGTSRPSALVRMSASHPKATESLRSSEMTLSADFVL